MPLPTGVLTFHGYRSIQTRGVVATPVDQRWFWTRRWQQREQEVDEHVGAGRVTVHDDGDALVSLVRDLTDES